MERTYYWEHTEDESKYLRSENPREVAGVAHAYGGEVGVILDDGGPLDIYPVPLGQTIRNTVCRLQAKAVRALGIVYDERPDRGELRWHAATGEIYRIISEPSDAVPKQGIGWRGYEVRIQSTEIEPSDMTEDEFESLEAITIPEFEDNEWPT